MLQQSASRFPTLGIAALVAGSIYVLLVFLAISPSERIEHHRRLGVEHDGEAIWKRPWNIVRYYGAMHGDPFVFYEHGMRLAGKPLPGPDSRLHRKLATFNDETRGTNRPLLPYRDFDCQYPPLAMLYFGMVAWASWDFDSYTQMLHLIHLGSVVAIAWISYYSAKRLVAVPGGAWHYAAVATLVVCAAGPRWLNAYDAIPALCVALAFWSSLRARWALAGAALAAGTLLKVYPVFLVPVVLVRAFCCGKWQAALRVSLGGLMLAAVTLAPWYSSGVSHVLAGVKRQSERQHLEYGSVAASLLIAGRQLGQTDFRYGDELQSRVLVSSASRRLAAIVPRLMLLGVAIVSLWYVRRCVRLDPRPESGLSQKQAFAFAMLALHLLTLFFAPVFSPQYVLWLLPVVLPLVGCSWATIAAAIVVGLSIQIQLPFVEGLPAAYQQPCLAITMLTRDAALLTMLVASYRDLIAKPMPLTRAKAI